MILSKHATIKIGPVNYNYWSGLGYNVKKTGGRAGKNTGQKLRVLVSHLQPGSNATVSCKCDSCGEKYLQRFSRNKDVCGSCRMKVSMRGNSFSKGHTEGKARCGENHPRWNPNKTAFKQYSNKIRWLTEKIYRENLDVLNPNKLPRTRCGVEGGYQLDHRVSIKNGFDMSLPYESIANLKNLQLVSWEENRNKSINNR